MSVVLLTELEQPLGSIPMRISFSRHQLFKLGSAFCPLPLRNTSQVSMKPVIVVTFVQVELGSLKQGLEIGSPAQVADGFGKQLSSPEIIPGRLDCGNEGGEIRLRRERH